MATVEEMKKELCYKPKHAIDLVDEAVVAAADDFCEGYKVFLDVAKTEREATEAVLAEARAKGFVEFEPDKKYSAGDKVYYVNRGKSIILAVIGKKCLCEGVKIAAAHIDSPRLDLKPNPLYESDELALFKTHYYGGIKKYQWVAIPLALHGVIIKADGTSVNVRIGEEAGEPKFVISDILPHLGAEQSKRTLSEGIQGEELNVIVGSRPFKSDEGSELVKLNILKLLNEKYGFDENDFLSAELSIVPAMKARDIGFDRSLIGSYGHDDRVCAYPALSAIFENADSEHSLMCILADKEETGSEGNTGMQADLFTDLIADISLGLGANERKVRANSKCLSADVSAAYDPNFPEVFEKSNTPLLSCGAVLTKYTGARGKSSTNDASAEYIAWLRATMDKDNVLWQTGELGKVDVGGGGTVAKYVAKHNVDTIDLGVPVISMHAPYEVVSKVDVYETYRAFCAFSKN